jgi:hypothetical protein
MTLRMKRFALLMVAVAVLAVAFAACSAPAAPTGALPGAGSGNVNGFHTPNPTDGTPTPTFSPFTIGAWPSNYSPGTSDTVTIYVVARIQDQTMLTPPRPAPGLAITFIAQDPVNQTGSAQTGPDGIATWTVTFKDEPAGKPARVEVSTTYLQQTYDAETFFTPGVNIGPTPTPKPGSTPTKSKATPTP